MNFKIQSTTNPNLSFKKETVSNSRQKNNLYKNLERAPKQDCFEISIGYVNDTHGQTNNMMRILSGLKGDLKLSAGDNDIGDEKNSGVHKATIKFLNRAGIVATAVGNHEMDTTQADLIESIKGYKGAMLASNFKKEMIEDEDAETVKKLGRAHLEKSLKPSKIINIKGENIGLIGASPIDMFERLTHPNYHTDCTVDELNITIKDIQNEIYKLKKQGINKIILLSHLGLNKDKKVAQNTDGLDIIIGGHTHELIKDIKEGENLLYSKTKEPVIITQAGRDGNYFGQLNIQFDEQGIVTKAQNNLGETALFHKNMIDKYLFDDALGKPEMVGYVKQAPPPPKTLTEENPHANFVCDIMREKTDSDIALWHLCGVRNFFHEGDLDSRDVKDISPFLDYVVVANVTEKALVDTFKDAIETTYAHSSRKPGLFATSGLDYTVNPETGKLVEMNFYDKSGNKINIDINNPRDDKVYKLVTDEFLMSAGADFKILAEEKDYIEKKNYDKDVMVCEYIKEKNKPVIINQYGRIKYAN